MTAAPVWKVVAGTGHRPNHLLPAQCQWLANRCRACVDWLVRERGMRVGITGMALGFDTWWAEALLADRRVQPWAYVPCPQQADRWPATARRRWKKLLGQISERGRVVVLSDRYHETVMHDRNDAMMDDAAAAVAGWRQTKRSGGTWHAVRSAGARGLPGVLLNPDRWQDRAGGTRLVNFADLAPPAASAA